MLAFIWLRYGDIIDNFILKEPNLPIFLSVISSSLILIHPRSINTPSYSRSYSILGIAGSNFSHNISKHIKVGLMYGSHLLQFKSTPDRLVLLLQPTLKKVFSQLEASPMWSMMSPEVWKVSIKMITGEENSNIQL